MSSNSKVNQTGSRALEIGKTDLPTNTHEGWNGDWKKDLNPTKPVAYLSLPLQKVFNTESDNQVTYGAQPSADVLQGITMENAYNFVNRFKGKDEDFAWAFGFETVQRVVLVTIDDTNTTDLTTIMSDTFTDGVNTLVPVRTEKVRYSDTTMGTLMVFTSTANIAERVAAVETLTNDGLGGDIIISKMWGDKFEHLFELPEDRNLRALSATEITAMENGDASAVYDDYQRSLMMRIAKTYGDHVVEGRHLMCETFKFGFSSGSPSQFESSTVAYTDRIFADEAAASADSIAFDMSCEERESLNNINFYQTMFEIDDNDAAYAGYTSVIEEGCTEINIEVSTPLQKNQDTKSGLQIAEPRIEGKYGFNANATVTYLSGTKYRDLRDARTYCHARVSAYRGAEMQEILIKKFLLDSAGGDDSNVPMEPLEMNISAPCDGHVFDSWLSYGGTNPEVYNSAIVMRVRNDNPNLAMTQSSPWTTL